MTLFGFLKCANINLKINRMKKIITIAVLAICLYSCEGFKQKNKNNKVTEDIFEYSGGSWSSLEYKIVEKTIDSCEYIIIFCGNLNLTWSCF